MEGVFRQSSTIAYEDPAKWIGAAIQDQENRSFTKVRVVMLDQNG